jgi:DNA invertase Pin-like site-specific DNA recombinase
MLTPVTIADPKSLRAAQYLRTSTDRQQYSIVNQSAAIALYAAANGFTIVRSYADAGKSGVRINGRHALQDLIETVQSGTADFQWILVYDVSRWGRFQDMDEAAHYEYVCKNAGIYVRYCAEEFENDDTLLSGLFKTMKRLRAAEYSRELSAKTFSAQLRLARMGFQQGAASLYGLDRLLVDSNSVPKQILRTGEHKAVPTDRVVLVAGPPEEVQTVRNIFNLCTIHRRTTLEIARELNRSLVKTRMGKEWTSEDVRCLIMNPKYMGDYVWGRTSKKLHAPRILNDPEQWVIRKGALAPTVSPRQFTVAQSRLRLQRPRYTDQQLLNILRALWEKEGTLSMRKINQSRPGPSAAMYTTRFGRLDNAFAMVGFKHDMDYDRIREENQRKRSLERGMQNEIAQQLRAIGAQISEDPKSSVLTLNETLGLAVKVMHYTRWKAKWSRVGWHFRINFRKGVHVLIIACLDSANQHIHSQYIIPKLAQLEGKYWINEAKGRVSFDACRSDTFRPLLNSVALTPLTELCNT